MIQRSIYSLEGQRRSLIAVLQNKSSSIIDILVSDIAVSLSIETFKTRSQHETPAMTIDCSAA